MFTDTNTNTNTIFYWAGSIPNYLIFGYFSRSQPAIVKKLENSNFQRSKEWSRIKPE